MLLVKQLMFSLLFAPYGFQIAEGGEKPANTQCNATLNIHTHCGNRMIISQGMIGERRVIYCEQFVLRFSFNRTH